MQTSNIIISKSQNRVLYFALTICGLLMLLLAQDYNWAGINLALALVFNPFPDKPFKELAFFQKTLILGQMGVAMLFIVLSAFQIVN